MLKRCTPACHAHAQAHIALLEATPESQAALLMGLEYLVNISYVEVSGSSSGCGCSLVVVARAQGTVNRSSGSGGSRSRSIRELHAAG